MKKHQINNAWGKKESSRIPSSLWPDDFLFSKLNREMEILDLGCGVGRLTLELGRLGHKVTGIDISEDAIKNANLNAEKKNLTDRCSFACESATSLPFDNNTFDVIIIQAVLTIIESKEDRKKILLESNRILKENGFVYLAEFSQNWHITGYRNKYLNHFSKTGEEGLFIVFDINGNEEYRAKHFSNKEISLLILDSGFSIDWFNTSIFKTKSGNDIEGFKIMLTKSRDAK